MENNGGLGMRNWGGYYEQPQMKGGLSLQLMSAGERDPKPMLPHGTFLQRECPVQEAPVPMEYLRDNWMYHHHQQQQHLSRESNKMVHIPSMNPSYGATSMDLHPAGHPHTLQILEQPDPSSRTGKAPASAAPGNGRKGNPSKKRGQEKNPGKAPKPKKPKNSLPQKEAAGKTKNSSSAQGKGPKKSMAMVISGMNLDISQLPTPVCSCTGTPQQCYRWGTGGWQSACCTTNISMYPLPMNTKRRGARIAGRKMSLGAFKKVLEKLVCEGFDLSGVIDLKTHWAKHGTNKFVTIK